MPRTFLSLLALLAACTPKQAPENASAPPAVVMHGVRLRSYDGSTLSMTGEAEQATWERTGDLTATRATVRVPDKGAPSGQKAGSTTVYAKLMEGSPGTRQMVASGDVEVRTSSGMVALTPRATYDGTQQVARGTEGVVVTGPSGRMRADSFSLSFASGQFDFEGSVQTIVQGAARD
ncbi:LPS export ABC transporter periplasmic protein LptC [Archangium lansingense]|uniref:LPS export ABC transporter periplasmic protein LptC n=1 Tax=Archangium lansingense TaxID=2995310 RepID=A0ABT3ZYM5_9BACT|nr:LPS export ABC transporter periplasmic protein LptC [Archangium lansinium]MCY1074500.1 LPS export ABC transporter periplasmic protein LptC [Archangium lansinium]